MELYYVIGIDCYRLSISFCLRMPDHRRISSRRITGHVIILVRFPACLPRQLSSRRVTPNWLYASSYRFHWLRRRRLLSFHYQYA